jgi:SAM-dependent methyltransferase
MSWVNHAMRTKLYWHGNSAKTRIINEILHETGSAPDKKVLIFDYGCGTGGDWPAILSDYPQLTLVAYDPSEQSIRTARERLKDRSAELFTGKNLQQLNFKADYIVSFSVLEHVYDRRTYLETAKSLLADDGTFYLNYDDGHFRNFLDLNAPRLWPDEIGVWLHNLLAEPLARLGRVTHFQARVNRRDIDELIAILGFRVIEIFYSNGFH